MKKRLSIMLLCLLAAYALTGCGGGETGGAVQATEAPTAQPKVEIVDYVQTAMDAAARLSGSVYFVAEDGSVIVPSGYDNEYSDNEFLPIYAALPNVRRIVASSSCSAVYALTDEGDVYFHDVKVAEGVTDFVYATTNSSESGIFISGDQACNIDVEDTEWVNPNLREMYPEKYMDVGGGKTISKYVWNPNFYNYAGESKEKLALEGVALSSVSVDKHDYLVLTESGRVFMDNNSGNSEEYETMEFFGWENMAVIDAAKRMGTGENRGNVETLTVAGIQADGTVLACGDYAEEILSWGPLSYISMDDGLIVGLTKEGTLRVTGQDAEEVAEFIGQWTGIVGVKVGNETDVKIINAVDAEGNFYYLETCFRWTTESADFISPEKGCSGENYFYKYCPDGTVYECDPGIGEWVLFEND